VAKILPGDECARGLERCQSAYIVKQDIVSRWGLSRQNSRCNRPGLFLGRRRLGRGLHIGYQDDVLEDAGYRRGGTCQHQRQAGDEQSRQPHPRARMTAHKNAV
jgi:hypothetical protein